MADLIVSDTLKMVRETLCMAVPFLGLSLDPRRDEHLARLKRLIDDIDRQRPLGPDGTHGDGDLCTPTCGCEDHG